MNKIDIINNDKINNNQQDINHIPAIKIEDMVDNINKLNIARIKARPISQHGGSKYSW